MMIALKLGSVGPAVRELQGNLRGEGFGIKPDGIFGPRTDQAVRAFQRREALKVDGVVGDRTWERLDGRPPAPTGGGEGDNFDAADYARWLVQGTGDALRSLFGPAAPPPARAQKAQSSPAPRPAARPPAAPRVGPRPPIVSPAQNRAHRRISFPGFQGSGYVVTDFRKYENYEVKLVGGKIVRPFTRSINNECAQFVQLFGVPHTSNWRRGPQVCHMEVGGLPVGTVVATLRDGKYHSDYSGRSHVGIYLGHDPYDPARGNGNAGGVHLFDQFNRAPIQRRTKMYSREADAQGKATRAWTDASGRERTHRVNWSGDGEEYFVLLTRS